MGPLMTQPGGLSDLWTRQGPEGETLAAESRKNIAAAAEQIMNILLALLQFILFIIILCYFDLSHFSKKTVSQTATTETSASP